MKKKLLKEMVLASYNEEELDAKNVSKFASYLSRKELKEYIRALKEQEMKMTIRVDSPYESKQTYVKEMQSLFPHKKIVFTVDPSLMFGIRITANDSVYELSLKDSLERMVRYLDEI